MMNNLYREPLYKNFYMSLYDDGTLGISDGVGSIDAIPKEEVRYLYLALKDYFESDKESEGWE